MDLLGISLDPLRSKTIAILGYGNQGSAHAQNLRDSGIDVKVGSRSGKSFDAAVRDGFSPITAQQASRQSDVVMFLLPDHIIPSVYTDVSEILLSGKKTVGFAHGSAYQFGGIRKFVECSYFLVGPKGAGAILRDRFKKGDGLPGVFALGAGATAQTRALCLAYAKAIGVGATFLRETTFQEETECDLFGEQAVLCGGILRLMEKAFDVLVRNGHSEEMAFLECCYEARLILELWLSFGPAGISERISPTAFFGGLTRGKRLIDERVEKELDRMFDEVRSGKFSSEWQTEVEKGMPQLKEEKKRLAQSALQRVYEKLRSEMNGF